jgi:hypothetical protein
MQMCFSPPPTTPGERRHSSSSWARRDTFCSSPATSYTKKPNVTLLRNIPTPSLLEALLGRITSVTADLSTPFPDGLPANDAVIFQAAVTCRASHLLTGDLHHFGPLMNRPEVTFSIIVQTVADFLATV